uniref:TMEM205-like domain-containing protein n=1 Tax=Oryza meridionalis TaxID=40149 RepID=A0A0E0FD60_9ORYZ
MYVHSVRWLEMLQLLLAVFVLLAGGPGLGTTAAAKAVHLLCFATSWGVTVWAILVGGVIMFLLRGKVFQACFALNAACTAASAAAFAWLHRPPWPPAERRQLAVLLVAAGFDLANLLIFTPRTLEMMKKRHKIERDLSIGEEVGWSKNVQVAKNNPTLAAINKKFGMIHGLSSLANIMSFGSLAMHSWYLASKLEM